MTPKQFYTEIRRAKLVYKQEHAVLSAVYSNLINSKTTYERKRFTHLVLTESYVRVVMLYSGSGVISRSAGKVTVLAGSLHHPFL